MRRFPGPMPEVTRNVAVALPPALFSQSLECPVALTLALTCQIDNFTAKVDGNVSLLIDMAKVRGHQAYNERRRFRHA